MEGHVPTNELWSRGPDMTVRKQKRTMEEELLQKLCVKKELMEFHPAILTSQPIKRLGFYITLNYSRVRPPAKEILPNSRNPTLINDPALRQLSNLSRLGPRDSFLPNLVKPYARMRMEEIPATDTEYHALRAVATDRLTKLFSEWPGFNRLAFPKSNRKKSLYHYAHHGKELSQSSLHMTAQGHHGLQPVSSMPSSGTDTKRGRHLIPDRSQTIQRWRKAMKEIRQHLLASRMQLPQVLSKSELIIYVSSTPDLQEEREFLEEVTYPKLLELCEGHGLGCHVIDLRSGSGMLTNDLETFHLIEKELQRCRKESIGPYFICLVGQALDDQELPGFLPQAVYELIRKTLIQEKIIGVEAFDEVYRLDSNQAPPVYIKQPISTLEEYKSVDEVVSVLHNALTQAVKAIARHKDASQASDVDFYRWSGDTSSLPRPT